MCTFTFQFCSCLHFCHRSLVYDPINKVHWFDIGHIMSFGKIAFFAFAYIRTWKSPKKLSFIFPSILAASVKGKVHGGNSDVTTVLVLLLPPDGLYLDGNSDGTTVLVMLLVGLPASDHSLQGFPTKTRRRKASLHLGWKGFPGFRYALPNVSVIVLPNISVRCKMHPIWILFCFVLCSN